MYRVIIVDDDYWAMKDIVRSFCFARHGFIVVAQCGSAEEALIDIVKHRPDMVITDIRMERESGLHLIRRCREKGIDALFIILSGYDRFDYAKEAIKQGAFYYMLKPIDDREANELMRQAAQALDNARISGHRCPDAAESSEDSFQKLLDYLEFNSTSHLDLDMLSETFFINRTYICDMFRKHLNTTFTKYLTDLRLKKAKELLETTALDISAVAARAGFGDASYFSRVFRKATGLPPLQYRAGRSRGDRGGGSAEKDKE